MILADILTAGGSLVCKGEEVSNMTMRLRSHEVAAAIPPGKGPVGVCVSRSSDLVAALLAVWRAGRTQLPLDPSYPAARLEYMLEDSGCETVICDAAGADAIGNFRGHIVSLRIMSTDYPVSDAPAHLAYMLYTSGSTGRPKGVCISHAALQNFARSMRKTPGITAQDRVLAVTPIGFDIAGLELHVALSAGATVVVATADEARDGAALSRLIDTHEVTIMQATPSTYRLLLETPPKRRVRALCGGEAWSWNLGIDRIADEVWNMYGPTETTIWSAVKRVQGEVRIGAPIDETEFFVLDEQMKEVSEGQLFIAGAGLADGYHRRPQLDAQRFLQWNGKRVYATGDLVVREAADTYRFLGRIDDQVKLRGHRIELGEIENQLCEHRDISAAAAIVKDERLHAFIVVRTPLEPAALRHHLEQTLPEYMVPARFVTVANLPLTPAGKVDRRALEAMV